MIRRWITMLILLLLVPVCVCAQNGYGCIGVKMAYNGNPVSGGTITLYDITDSPEKAGPTELLVYVKELGIKGIEKKIDGSGVVMFDGLQAGRYLLVQQKAAAGFYPVKPFVVQLSLNADGTAIDAIEAVPKLEPEKKLPQTGQVVWPAWMLLASGMLLVGIGMLGRERE